MLFNSFEFMLFLPIAFLLYWLVFRERRFQNLLIVVASYLFYGWWDWRFLCLISFTSLCSYGSGLLIELYEGKRNCQKYLCVTNIVLNLSILAIFKYYNFFVENLDALLGLVGYHLDWVTMNIILPVGISFYTFQALSYTIDIYQKKLPATHDIVEFFAYISFFPQLVAGPIERATNLLPQFQKDRQFDYEKAVDGCRQMLWGFFKKLVIADNCASAVNSHWNSYADLPGFSIFFLGVLFSFQIYCDFSGYSDIAIGCARLFGLNLKRNFDYPYFSRSIPEFWRRWHISLMTWFRDYIYIPLGGSRGNHWKTIRNILIVFFISGLWHGANWTFICWGMWHACLIVFFLVLGINTKTRNNVTQRKYFPSVKEFFQISTTFLLVVFGWMLFRANGIEEFYNIIHSIVVNQPFVYGSIYGKTVFLHVLLMVIIDWIQRDKQHSLQFPNNVIFSHRFNRWLVYIILYLYIISCTGQSQTFLYFQF